MESSVSSRRLPSPSLRTRSRLQITLLRLRSFQRREVELRLTSFQTLPSPKGLPVIPHQGAHPRLHVPVQRQGRIVHACNLPADVRDLILRLLIRDLHDTWPRPSWIRLPGLLFGLTGLLLLLVGLLRTGRGVDVGILVPRSVVCRDYGIPDHGFGHGIGGGILGGGIGGGDV